MLELNYSGEKTIHKVDFDIVSEHIVKIVGTLPAKTKGFTLSNSLFNFTESYSTTSAFTIYGRRQNRITNSAEANNI